MQQLDHAQLVAAPLSTKFYRIHALPYEMQSEAARPHIFQLPPTELFAVYCHAAVFQDDFESRLLQAIPGHLNAAKRRFNWLFCSPLIRMPNDICQGLIDGQNYGTAFGLGKSQSLRKFSRCVSDNAKTLGIAAQFHSEE